MSYPHHPYYQDRRSVSDLCYDFPADEPLVEGLHAMQVHFVRNGVNVDIPVLRVMNTAHFLASYMFATTCSDDQLEYDVLAYMSVGHDKQMMLMTMIVLAAMLKRTDGIRASQCRNVLLEDRSEDFYEGVSLYERFITSAEERFAEQDFMTDVMAEVTDLRELAEQLINEKTQLQKQITEMENEKHTAPIINVAGNYIDIHDNHNCNIYATEPATAETEKVTKPEPEEREFFCRITQEAIDNGKAQTVDDDLRSASISAPKLVKAIRTNEALDYLDTKNLSSAELFRLLDEHYHLPFKYRQFAAARSL